MSAPLSRRDVLRAGVLAGGVGAVAACTPAPGGPEATGVPTTPPLTPAGGPTVPVDSWAPAPVETGGLSLVARQHGGALALLTTGGERTFWAGVTLRTGVPGRLPSEGAVTTAQYRRWLRMIGQLGIRMIRLPDVHPPHFYTELRTYNDAHADAPLYVLHGVPIPASPSSEGTLFGDGITATMTDAVRDAVAAVHGTLRRPDGDGIRGTWTSDVSDWVAGWVIGSPLDPALVLRTDRDGADRAPHDGTFFFTATGASATETWLAARMDEVAALEAAQGRCVPVAAVATPTTDPLDHPEEPTEAGDLVGIDVNHIAARVSWPAGTFAAYDAYPFGAEFLRLQPSYQTGDAYRAYLSELTTHHSGRPVLLTEFGVPASLGISAPGPDDRAGGFHTEQEAATQNAEALRLVRDIGLAGAFLPDWADDWSAQAANTAPRHAAVEPSRRVAWHDALTAPQWAGLLAFEPTRAGERVVYDQPSEMTKVVVDHDATYLYMTLSFTRRVTSPVDIGFDFLGDGGLYLPGGTGQAVYDVALHLTPTMSTVTMFVRRTLDPVRLNDLPTVYLPRADRRGWIVHQLLLNPPRRAPGRQMQTAEMQRVGDLVLGSWDPRSSDYHSLATWQLVRPDPEQPMEFRLRLPWGMLAMADPSTRRALVPQLGEPELVTIEGMNVFVESSTPGAPAAFRIDWSEWDTPTFTERLKVGHETLTEAFLDVNGT